MRRQVVISGLGLITPLGVGVETFWNGLLAGACAVRRPQRFDAAGLRATHYAELPPIDYRAWLEPRQAAQWTETTKLAVAGGLMAARDARLSGFEPPRLGVILGTGYGSIYDFEALFTAYGESHGRRLRATTVPRVMPNAPASHLAIALGARGPTFTVSTACSSAAVAVALAVQQIRAGALDACLTGGYDLVLNRFDAVAWDGLRVLSRRDAPSACRPFSKDREGMVLGEGCGALIVETAASAVGRGAPIYAEIKGVGLSNDAHDIAHPGEDGPVEAIHAALADAGLAGAEIDYVNAHGTGSEANDDNELAALERALGARAREVPISSIKGAIGHTMGAAGSIELAAAALAVRTGWVPPTLHLEDPLDGFRVEPLRPGAGPRELRHALSTSFGFGGQNAAIIVARA